MEYPDLKRVLNSVSAAKNELLNETDFMERYDIKEEDYPAFLDFAEKNILEKLKTSKEVKSYFTMYALAYFHMFLLDYTYELILDQILDE